MKRKFPTELTAGHVKGSGVFGVVIALAFFSVLIIFTLSFALLRLNEHPRSSNGIPLSRDPHADTTEPLEILWANAMNSGERASTLGHIGRPLIVTDCRREIRYIYGLPKSESFANFGVIVFTFPPHTHVEVYVPEKLKHQIYIAYSVENIIYKPKYTREYMKGLGMDYIISYDRRSEYWYSRVNRLYLGDLKFGIEEFRKELVPFKDKIPKISMFYSNCITESKREDFIASLIELFPIDSYGSCMRNMNQFKFKFSRSQLNFEQKLNVTSNYMFSMAMENGYTPDYVSEKLYQALLVGSIPIYEGAENVNEYVPEHSIIRTSDFKNAAELANHLKEVASNQTLYSEYLAWKSKPFPKHFFDTYRHSLDNFHCFICKAIVNGDKMCPFDE